MNFWQNITRSISKTLDIIIGSVRAAKGDPDAWERSIRRFEAQDRIQPPPPGTIVFTGSSSFTLWSSMVPDLAPLPVINRGFGGARMQDVIHYTARCVLPYRPRAVVLFAGTNDVAEPHPATARQVFDGYRAFVEAVHTALPDTPIYYVAITPTPLRWKLWPIADEANRMIEVYGRNDPRLRFIDLGPQFLDPDGKPDKSFYRFDRLHPNKKGYTVWTSVIKPRLQADLFPR